ncbi:MAG: AAA family ATPase [Helicobacteraceae bacterium]|nr:AAA family ATPase [Helicobacteraceae bacterium]
MLELILKYQQGYLKKIKKYPYKRYMHQDISFKNRLTGLLGARGVGKTTFLLQYLQEVDISDEKKLYLSVDNLEIDSLFEIAEYFEKMGGELLIIDEIHKYQGFELELKKIYDILDIKIIFSGSSALQLDHSKADLSRRAVVHYVKGLSFREFLEFKTGAEFESYSLETILKNHLSIASNITQRIKPFEYFDEYIKYGYYPFYFENEDEYLLKLSQTINTVIEVDIPAIFPIEYKNLINLKKLVKLICISKPFKINLKELMQKMGLNDYKSLYRLLDYLDKAKIIRVVKSQSKGDSIFSKPDKLYLNNTNLLFAYCKNSEVGTTREIFFSSMFDDLLSATKGDFLIDERYTFEIGSKNKSFKQIKDLDDSFVVADEIEVGYKNKIPLYLFGFLY